MLAIVRIALNKPYTFVVMAMLIVIFGVTAAIKTPTDIFPNIGIPVVAVVWTYDGLPADDMSKRVIYYYERILSSQVNNIEHIESQSLPRYGIVKVFFQPGVNINGALAQMTAASQTVLKYLPPGITPPFVLSFNASSVPVIQLALSSKSLSQAQIFDLGQNFIRPQLSSVAGTAIPSPYGGKILQVQVDINQQKLRSLRAVGGGRRQRDRPAEHRDPRRNGEGRRLRIHGLAQRLANSARRAQRHAHSRRRRHDGLPSRCRLRPCRRAAANQHGSRRRLERRVDDDPEDGEGVDA